MRKPRPGTLCNLPKVTQEAEEPGIQVCLIPEAEHLTTEYQPLRAMRAVAAPVVLLNDDQFAHLSPSGCELLEGKPGSGLSNGPWHGASPWADFRLVCFFSKFLRETLHEMGSDPSRICAWQIW